MRVFVAGRILRAGAVAALGAALFLPGAAMRPRQEAARTTPSEIVLTIDPAQSKVHWNVDSTLHKVHGTFGLKSGSVHVDPETGKASGEIVVLATSGESGSDARDARTHKEILEEISRGGVPADADGGESGGVGDVGGEAARRARDSWNGA
jgi:polyisoprenoid-binding protein YceI